MSNLLENVDASNSQFSNYLSFKLLSVENLFLVELWCVEQNNFEYKNFLLFLFLFCKNRYGILRAISNKPAWPVFILRKGQIYQKETPYSRLFYMIYNNVTMSIAKASVFYTKHVESKQNRYITLGRRRKLRLTTRGLARIYQNSHYPDPSAPIPFYIE